jgi:hypothetical protein
MYRSEKMIVGVGSVGLALLLTCHASGQTSTAPAVPSDVTKPAGKAFQDMRGPVLQQWNPSSFERATAPWRTHSPRPVRFHRAIMNDTADEIVDRLAIDEGSHWARMPSSKQDWTHAASNRQ